MFDSLQNAFNSTCHTLGVNPYVAKRVLVNMALGSTFYFYGRYTYGDDYSLPAVALVGSLNLLFASRDNFLFLGITSVGAIVGSVVLAMNYCNEYSNHTGLNICPLTFSPSLCGLIGILGPATKAVDYITTEIYPLTTALRNERRVGLEISASTHARA